MWLEIDCFSWPHCQGISFWLNWKKFIIFCVKLEEIGYKKELTPLPRIRRLYEQVYRQQNPAHQMFLTNRWGTRSNRQWNHRPMLTRLPRKSNRQATWLKLLFRLLLDNLQRKCFSYGCSFGCTSKRNAWCDRGE